MNRGLFGAQERLLTLADPGQRPQSLVRQSFSKRPGLWFTEQDRASANLNMTSGVLYLSRIVIPEPCVLEQFGVEVTGGATSSTNHLAVYESDAYGQPNRLAQYGGTFDAGTTGFKNGVVNLDVWGVYWLAALSGSSTPSYRSVEAPPHDNIGATAQSSLTGSSSLFALSVSGVLPMVIDAAVAVPAAQASSTVSVRFTYKIAP